MALKRPFNPETSSKVKCYENNGTYLAGKIFTLEQLDYNVKIFPLQVSVYYAISTVILLLLRPFGETPVVAQIMTGIIIGLSGLSRIKMFQEAVFPEDGGTFLVETLGNLGCMVYVFLIGVKMDLSVLKRSSNKEKAIGITTFILPLMLTMPPALLMQIYNASYFADKLDTELYTIQHLELTGTAMMASTSSFHVIACFLTDLKILNTDLGRISTTASTISGICSLMASLITSAMKDNEKSGASVWVMFTFSALAQIIFITVVLRTIVIWMIKRTPQGKGVKDVYILSIFLMILGTGLIGEICGQHFIFGPMILGLAIPNGPPIGSALADKFDAFTSGVLLPLYFCHIGYKVNLVRLEKYHVLTMAPLCVLGFLGKFMGTFLVCFFYQVPFEDALMLGLTLSTLGLVDIHNYRVALSSQVITLESFTLLVTSAMILAGVIAPIVHFFYDPARRYVVGKKRTIQNLKPNAEFRVLVCIYNDESVPTAVNILQASNPTKETPIVIYLLHLVELMGRSTPLLITHQPHRNHFDSPTPSDRIINSFKIFEKKHHGAVLLHPFTSMTLLMSAQEDICTLALDKRTSFIVIPFHKQWNIDRTTQTNKWRNTNRKVLKQAPCSVGILIDREVFHGARSVLSAWSTYNIAVIFLGDADDREALCYGMRMAGNPDVYLTVYRLVLVDFMADDVSEKMLDENMINEYKLYNKDIERNSYDEETVKDGVGIINFIRTLQNSYDLILVGRSHTSYYSLFSDFLEWNEFPELGFFGDMLASSDFNGNASVLIVQQHSSMQTEVMRDDATKQSYTSRTWQ